MPELPEVETVINNLKPKIINHKINKINIYYLKLLKNSSLTNFVDFLINETVVDIKRKGKYIIICLTNNKYFVVHLRMEGKLFFEPFNSQVVLPQLLAEFELDNGLLRYYDTRKFGTFEIGYNLCELSLNKLAMDANSDQFNDQYLYESIHNKKICIKNALLDQTIVAGIGNIYVNEILFCSKIDPEKSCCNLNIYDCANIVKYSKEILNKSIENYGTTIHSFLFDDNKSGQYQKYLLVHNKRHHLCINCKNKIQFKKINGRGTYYCPYCQK